MGSFRRSGRFQDRGRFLAALRAKIAGLKEGALRGLEETWSEEGGESRGSLTGFGVSVSFRVGAGEWECEAQIPSWLPIPQSSIEEKFDREFAELGNA